MSLYGAMSIGVAGLAANSAALSATSSNIANVNTVGYKNATASFATFLNSNMGTSTNSAGGVAAIIGQDVTSQGLPTSTSSPTDLSIAGNGFFIVASNGTGSGTQEYTRAGGFHPDANGNLVNASGLYLLGYKLDSAGNAPADSTDLSLVNVSSLSGSAQASATMSMQANLSASSAVDSTYVAGDMASGTVNPDFSRSINVYDSQGGTQPITFAFIKTGANSWNYEATYAGASTNLTSAAPISQGTITFNSDGTLANVNGASPASGTLSMTIPWNPATSGLAPQALQVNLGTVASSDGLTQYNGSSALIGSKVDGSAFGSVTGVSIAKDGTVTAQFSNGLTQDAYRIPVVTFANPDGLGQLSGNAYAATKGSGAPNINIANTGGAGAVQSQSLEGSTVDLATEFTNLITTQRAYSASARIITTANQMLQQLEQLPSN